MRWIAVLICSAVVSSGVPFAQSQTAGKTAAQPAAKQSVTHLTLPHSLLPDAFAGWIEDGPAKSIPDAAQADPANAAALAEYGFTSGVLATYKREGETLSLRALRFPDASGAYGAYTYYRQNGWPKEEIGTGATSNHNRVLFWAGNTVVDANFSHIGPMSGSELRELARQLPMPDGNKALAPPILANEPQAQLDPQTTHYAVGPASYAGSGGVLPPGLVDFDRGPEAITSNYKLRSGIATLTIIDYPTPQMALAMEPKIRAYIKSGSQAQPPWPKPLQDSDLASLEVRRSGPLVVIVSGDAIPEESHRLLESVHYDADLTAIPQPSTSEIAKTGKLLMGIAVLVVIGSGAAILLGFFMGGFRALYRIARGRPASSVFDAEFIRIDLRDEISPAAQDAPLGIEGPHTKG
jgi:hypothetical protein